MITAIAIFEKRSSSEPTSTETSWPLQEHRDANPKGQTKDLSPLGEINHEINFMLGARSPAKDECHVKISPLAQ